VLRIRLVATLLMALTSTPALGFSGYLHELVCEMALELVDRETRNFVTAVVNESNVAPGFDSFASACSWADEVRRTTHRETYEYHFINTPRIARLNFPRDCAAQDCVTQAVMRYANYLASPGSNADTRKEALLFLGHFVADLHQPMHVANLEDLGGNRINVLLVSANDQQRSNLHRVWDNDMGRAARLHYRNALGRLMDGVRIADREQWLTGGINSWAMETHLLARSVAYRMPDGSAIVNGAELGPDYFEQGVPVVTQQIMKAGVRLALLLELAGRGEISPALLGN